MNIKAPLPSDVPALRKLWLEAFGDSEDFLDCFFSTAFSMNRCRCIMSDNVLAAALYWFDCIYMGKPIAYLYAVATVKAYQGQGLCHKLMKDTHWQLKKLGYVGAILVPSNARLFELYQGLGYQTCSYIREFRCLSLSEKLTLRRIDKQEYAKLRRQLLPQGSVLQENENLDFLETQADFYTGDRFLLAARSESDTLYGIELLGDLTIAPRIAYALGYTKGIFRTPGSEIPFAMFHPLGNLTLPPPSYFGLAFD